MTKAFSRFEMHDGREKKMFGFEWFLLEEYYWHIFGINEKIPIGFYVIYSIDIFAIKKANPASLPLSLGHIRINLNEIGTFTDTHFGQLGVIVIMKLPLDPQKRLQPLKIVTTKSFQWLLSTMSFSLHETNCLWL